MYLKCSECGSTNTCRLKCYRGSPKHGDPKDLTQKPMTIDEGKGNYWDWVGYCYDCGTLYDYESDRVINIMRDINEERSVI